MKHQFKKSILAILLLFALVVNSQITETQVISQEPITIVERDALTVPAGEFWEIYNSDTDQKERWNGSAWVATSPSLQEVTDGGNRTKTDIYFDPVSGTYPYLRINEYGIDNDAGNVAGNKKSTLNSEFLDLRENAGNSTTIYNDRIQYFDLSEFAKLIIRYDNITTDNTIQYPDASGTFALTSQIPTNIDYVDLTTSQTVAGDKTLTGNLAVNGFVGIGAAPTTDKVTVVSNDIGGAAVLHLKKTGLGGFNDIKFTGVHGVTFATHVGKLRFDPTKGFDFIFDDVIKLAINKNGEVKTSKYTLDALNTAPSSATDTGVLGEIRVTATHIYVCTATNVWARTALATW